MTQTVAVSELKNGRRASCRSVLSSLPKWFGIPEAVEAYVAAAEKLPMLVARVNGEEVVGFLSMQFHTEAAAEAVVLGVRPEWHRQGVGRKLFEAAAELARSRGCKYLTVKTLATAHPDPHYRATRLFYEAMGFEPIEVFPTLWDPRNPCLLMLKRLDY